MNGFSRAYVPRDVGSAEDSGYTPSNCHKDPVSDLNINRELIWCKGRKQWFLVSCKGQPQGNYLFRNTVSCHFHLTNVLIVDLLPNKLLESCVISFSNGGRQEPLFLQASNKTTSCVSVFINDCPHVLSWRKFIRKTGRHKETKKFRSYNNLSFSFTLTPWICKSSLHDRPKVPSPFFVPG